MAKSGWAIAGIILGMILIIGAIVTITILAPKLSQEAVAAPLAETIVKSINGDFECKFTGDYQASKSVVGVQKSGGILNVLKWDEFTFSCLDAGTIGCQVKIDSFSCSSHNTGWSTSKAEYSINDGSWQTDFSSSKHINNGDTIKIKTHCTASYYPDVGISNVYSQQPSKKLYVNTYGQAWSGYLSGSEGCKLVSGDVSSNAILNAQLISGSTNANKLYAGQTFPLGLSTNFIVGWQEVTSLGNMNPLGQYNGNNVICKAFIGIYKLDPLTTVGGKNYYQEGSQLAAYSSDNTLCCNNGECASQSGYVCEKYHCTKAPQTCTYGSCNAIQKGNIISTDYIEGAGKFYEVASTCGSDLCISQTKKEVSCTRDYCDRQYGTDYYCDYSKGCVPISILTDCGNGMCCDGGNYKLQSCASGKECCKNVGDVYRGTCKDSCSVVELGDSIGAGTGTLECNKWYQQEGVDTTYKYNFLGLKFGATDKPACHFATWVTISAVVLVLLVFIIFLIILLRIYLGIKRKITG